MLDPMYLNVLRIIYTRLKHTTVNWTLTGSLSFALQGIPIEPHDIDVQTDRAGAYEIERLFAEYLVKKVTFSSSDKMRSHLGALAINGITVEIMGDIQKRLEDGSWEEPVDPARHKRIVVVEDMQVPVLSLEYEYQAYLKMGRIERAQMIKQVLSKSDQP